MQAATLHAQLEGLERLLERALSASATDPAANEIRALLQEASGRVRSAHGISRARLAKARTGATDVPALPPPTPSRAPAGASESSIDQEEREERELAARRAQFALGAADEDEDIDWGHFVGADAGSDDEGAMGGDDDGAMAAAAARVLEDLDGFDGEDASKPVRGWDVDDAEYVPQGTAGFNEYARTKMREAGVPANQRVLPPSDLAPTQWVDGAVQPKLQCYQETVAFLCRPAALPNPRMLVVCMPPMAPRALA